MREYDKYPFDQSVLVEQGKLLEGSVNRQTFYHYHLIPFPLIIGPYDRDWGGEMFPNLLFSKSTVNKSWFKLAVRRTTSPTTYFYEYDHVFYDNGWRNLY